MHINNWWTIYFTLLPSTVIFLIAIILLLARSGWAKHFFIAGACCLLLPIIFIILDIASQRSAMKKREGIYVVLYQDTIDGSCAGKRFDSLKLTLNRSGKFTFNYLPCFTNKINGNWKWTDNMVHSYSRFDKLNDSLELDIPSETNVDTIILTNYRKRYITFAKLK